MNMTITSSASLPSSSSSSSFSFKFPAIFQRPSRWSSHFNPTNRDSGIKGIVCGMRRRPGLISIAATPFLVHLPEYMVGLPTQAVELGTNMDALIREEVRKVVSKAKAAGVLRLVFHDAGTFQMDDSSGGMNGSIRYELERPENAGLKKPVKVLEKAKKELDDKQVSWADMIAVAGAEAVSICGGPSITVNLGRLDSMKPDPEGRLPEESLDASGLKKCFWRKGFLVQELVALSGAHTLGSKGFGNPTVFDNSYYKILMEKPWMSSAGMSSMIGLPSDRALVEDSECIRWIENYANNQDMFFEDFKSAYVKLVNSGARWKSL